MEANNIRLYGYRWVVLGVFMFINLTIQILWIAYAPITGVAAKFYGVGDLQIGFLSMLFMIAFVPLAIPVSWAIDSYGFHKTVSLGAILMGIFGILRGLAGSDYTLVMISTIGLAIAQPFLLNSWTTVPAKWFGVQERATAVGLVTLSSLVGTAIGMVLTPILIETYTIPQVQLVYGCVAAFSAILFIFLSKEKPATPPCPPGMEVRALMLAGLKHAFQIRDFWVFLGVIFIGLGLFNGITTWVENIIRPRGFSPTEAGTLGAVLLVGGILGAVILPPFSDKQKKRVKFLMLGIALSIPGLIGLTFAKEFWLLLLSGFSLGFFLVSTSPIGMQYAAEITHPTPEGTSNGILQMFGQIAVVFVFIMEALKTKDGSFTPSLLLGVGLLIVCILIITRLKDPVEIKQVS